MLSRRMQCAGLFAMAMISFGGAMASETDAPFVVEQRDRRDPFTFRSKFGVQAVKEDVTGCYPVPPVPPTFDLIAARAKLQETYARAENAFLDAQFPQSLQGCDEGLTVLQSIPENQRASFGTFQNDLARLRTATERQIQRAEAQRQFDSLNVSLTGVVVHDRQSQAIVNAKIVSRGELVPLTNSPQDVIVLEIRPQEVVFLFHGYRMPVAIKDNADH